jgi:hypothetical protein
LPGANGVHAPGTAPISGNRLFIGFQIIVAARNHIHCPCNLRQRTAASIPPQALRKFNP